MKIKGDSESRFIGNLNDLLKEPPFRLTSHFAKFTSTKTLALIHAIISYHCPHYIKLLS